jgi:hypothetical protein
VAVNPGIGCVGPGEMGPRHVDRERDIGDHGEAEEQRGEFHEGGASLRRRVGSGEIRRPHWRLRMTAAYLFAFRNF